MQTKSDLLVIVHHINVSEIRIMTNMLTQGNLNLITKYQLPLQDASLT